MHKGILTDDQLQLALAEQQRSGTPLGEILVRLGFVVGPTIANALAEQHGGPLRTEYGLSIGPTGPAGTPPDPTRNPNPVPAPADTREQDTAIARMYADLASVAGQVAAATAEAANARRELDALRLALEDREAELAKAQLHVAALEQALAAATVAAKPGPEPEHLLFVPAP